MARSSIPVTEIDRDGVVRPSLTNGDSSNDHYVTGGADGRTMLEIVSTDAGSQTVEIVPSSTAYDGLTISNLVIAVGAGETVFAGPFRTSTFKQDSDNTLYVNPSVSNTIDFRAWRLPTP